MFILQLGRVPLLGLVVLFTACGAPAQDKASDKSLELYSWWTNPGETDALDALLDEYRAQYPQTDVINATVKDVNNAHEQLRARMVAGSPPDTFQALGGGDLLKWVIPDGSSDSVTKMEPVDDLAEALGLANIVPPSVTAAMSHNGKMYGIPIGVHRYNVLYFNKKLFGDNDLEAPTSLSEFYEVAEAFQAKGITPLALGTKQGWPLTQIAIDGVLIAKAGVAFHESYLTGQEAPNDPRLVDALEEVVRMLAYTNANRDAITWDEAAAMVAEGDAAMTIMGDWAKGFFLSKGLRAGVDLGQVPVPGTEGVFVYLVDSFTLPKGALNRQAAVNFLNLVGSAEMQNVFNPIKGSTPPRTDADLSRYDRLAQETIDDFAADTLTSGRQVKVTSPEFNAELDKTMKQFGVDGNVDTVVNMLTNWYDLLE